jgi:hypothetical protein
VGKEFTTRNLNVQGPVTLTALKAETLEVNGPVILKKAMEKDPAKRYQSTPK